MAGKKKVDYEFSKNRKMCLNKYYLEFEHIEGVIF